MQHVKLPHEFEVGNRKTATELCGQTFSQEPQHLLAVLRTSCALLLKLNNVPPNLEVGVHLHQINATRDRAAGGLYQRANVGKKR
jgi:hypothetical protein